MELCPKIYSRGLFLIAGLRPEILLTTRLQHRCFPINFAIYSFKYIFYSIASGFSQVIKHEIIQCF